MRDEPQAAILGIRLVALIEQLQRGFVPHLLSILAFVDPLARTRTLRPTRANGFHRLRLTPSVLHERAFQRDHRMVFFLTPNCVTHFAALVLGVTQPTRIPKVAQTSVRRRALRPAALVQERIDLGLGQLGPTGNPSITARCTCRLWSAAVVVSKGFSCLLGFPALATTLTLAPLRFARSDPTRLRAQTDVDPSGNLVRFIHIDERRGLIVQKPEVLGKDVRRVSVLDLKTVVLLVAFGCKRFELPILREFIHLHDVVNDAAKLVRLVRLQNRKRVAHLEVLMVLTQRLVKFGNIVRNVHPASVLLERFDLSVSTIPECDVHKEQLLVQGMVNRHVPIDNPCRVTADHIPQHVLALAVLGHDALFAACHQSRTNDAHQQRMHRVPLSRDSQLFSRRPPQCKLGILLDASADASELRAVCPQRLEVLPYNIRLRKPLQLWHDRFQPRRYGGASRKEFHVERVRRRLNDLWFFAFRESDLRRWSRWHRKASRRLPRTARATRSRRTGRSASASTVVRA